MIEVEALINIFGSAMRGNEVLQQFDLVAANSGGSIVLGGLVEDVTLQELLSYFMDQVNRNAIFTPTSSVFDQTLEGLLGFGPKYSATAKLPALETLLPQTGSRILRGINDDLNGYNGNPVRLMIVGFDYDRNRGTFFRSYPVASPCLGIANAADITLAEAIHASTNAPVNYFDGPATFPVRTVRYWDGGISGHNNPVLAAVTEAMLLGVPPQNIAALKSRYRDSSTLARRTRPARIALLCILAEFRLGWRYRQDWQFDPGRSARFREFYSPCHDSGSHFSAAGCSQPYRAHEPSNRTGPCRWPVAAAGRHDCRTIPVFVRHWHRRSVAEPGQRHRCLCRSLAIRPNDQPANPYR